MPEGVVKTREMDAYTNDGRAVERDWMVVLTQLPSCVHAWTTTTLFG